MNEHARGLPSHPQLRFDTACVDDIDAMTISDIGDARAACEQVAALPAPTLAALTDRAIVAAAHASAAIENNPLTEAACEDMYRGRDAPPGAAPLAVRELRNTLNEYVRLADGGPLPITTENICATNRNLLCGATHHRDIVPGKIRAYPVRVGAYYPPDAAICSSLLGRLARWFNSPTWHAPGADPFLRGALMAFIGHLYLGWIHPFGDGNGRTSRLVESSLLIERAGVPMPVALATSVFYWQNRNAYYDAWRLADLSGEVTEFVAFAADGLRVISEDCVDHARNSAAFCAAAPRRRAATNSASVSSSAP